MVEVVAMHGQPMSAVPEVSALSNDEDTIELSALESPQPLKLIDEINKNPS